MRADEGGGLPRTTREIPRTRYIGQTRTRVGAPVPGCRGLALTRTAAVFGAADGNGPAAAGQWRRAVAALRKSWLRGPIALSGMAFGHTAVHSPVFVHPPNPASSCAATMSSTRAAHSGWPCGSRPRWATLAAVNSIAEPFGQAATHAPQPMQAAA